MSKLCQADFQNCDVPPWFQATYRLVIELMSGAEKMFLSGEASYPVERTLLTGGVVEAGCQSLTLKRRVETPHMAGLTYAAPAQSLFGGHGEPHDYRAVRHGRVIRCATPAQPRLLDWC